jgi:hypothetical protein
VNTIFLTDGESNPVNTSNIRTDNYPYKRKGNKYILRDNVSKKEYNFLGSYSNADAKITNVLLKILKDRTGSNLIGFFLSTDRIKSLYYHYYGVSTDFSKIDNFWKENGFIPVKSAGYDEYYVINARALNIKEEKLAVDSTMSKTKIAKEFIKFAERKSVNRVLLRQFIEKISSQSRQAA